MIIYGGDPISHFVSVYIGGEKVGYCTMVDTDAGTIDRYPDNGRGDLVCDATETVKCEFKLKLSEDAPQEVVDWFNTNIPEKNRFVE